MSRCTCAPQNPESRCTDCKPASSHIPIRAGGSYTARGSDLTCRAGGEMPSSSFYGEMDRYPARRARAGGGETFAECVARTGNTYACAGAASSGASSSSKCTTKNKKPNDDGCPLPDGVIYTAQVAHQIAQPFAYAAANAYVNFWVMLLPIAIALFPIVAFNFLMMELPYIILVFVAACGNPVKAAIGEATTALDSCRKLRRFYEDHPAVSAIPFSDELYDALGFAELCLIPLAEGRAPTNKEWQHGDAAMRTVTENDEDAANAARAAEDVDAHLTSSQKAKGKRWAEKHNGQIACLLELAKQRGQAVATTESKGTYTGMAQQISLSVHDCTDTTRQQVYRDLVSIQQGANKGAFGLTANKKEGLRIAKFLDAWTKGGATLDTQSLIDLWASIGAPLPASDANYFLVAPNVCAANVPTKGSRDGNGLLYLAGVGVGAKLLGFL